MLAYENYIYSKGYETTNHINVYCSKRTAKGCMARGKFLKLSGRIILTVQHNHEAIEGEPEAKCRMYVMKREPNRNKLENRRDLVDRMLKNVAPRQINAMPSARSMADTISRERAQDEEHIKTPGSLEDLDTDSLAALRTCLWEKMLQFDSGIVRGIRVLVFATRTNLEFLATCDTICIDGTFDPRPKLFTQLWTIGGLINGHLEQGFSNHNGQRSKNDRSIR
uniref:FLYWCH-type domain-containing protein n=1 Tax=Acrobeloides nanus TaxID=290746 RepID=A0A914EBJ0_9BILA